MSTPAVSPAVHSASTSERAPTTTGAPAMLITVDGPTTVTVDGCPVSLSPSERLVVAALVLHRRRGATLDALSRLRWPDGDAPRAARQSLHNSISRIRQKTGLQLSLDHGRYRLSSTAAADIDWLDATPDGVAAATTVTSDARTSGVGQPAWFADLPDLPEVVGERNRLDRALDEALAHQITTLRQDGHITEALVIATRRRTAAPQLDDPWAQEVELLLALGRRLDAAALYRTACRTITDLRGESPGPALRTLQAWIWGTTPSQVEAARQPLVGRAEEVKEVRRQLTGGTAVLLVGAAGSGKSTTAQDVVRNWPGSTRTIACGQSRMTALASIRDVLAATDAVADRSAQPRTSTQLDDLVDHLVQSLQDTALLLLDDVDRLAPLSREVLMGALRQVDCRVLATSRTASCGVLGRSNVATVELGLLSLTELARLARVSLRDARALVALVGPTPRDVVELAETCRTTRVTPSSLTRLSTAGRVPGPIVRVISGTLERHSRAVATLADQVALGVVREAVAVDQHTLDDAIGVGGPLQYDERGHLTFTHPLLRRIVLERLPPGLREEALLLAALHASYAQADPMDEAPQPVVPTSEASTPLAA